LKSGVTGIRCHDEERWVNESKACIRNNRAFIPNFGKRFSQRGTITMPFATINQVVSKRRKKQPMQ
jgi:hypothetical protein